MRMKNLALALMLSGGLVAPALAQTPAAPAAKPAAQAAPTTAAAPTPATAPHAPATTATSSAMPAMQMTNINTASAADLDKLPQIGKARARKIIGGRPYKAIDDLLTKKILTKGVYDKIKDKITVG